MSWTDTRRIIKGGYKNFARNGIVSLASVLVVTITISVITALIFLQAILNFSLLQIKDKVDVTVYFTTDASEQKILSFKSSLEQLPEVADVAYVSRDQALAEFKARHASDYTTLQALDELDDNPLGASLNIRAKETSQYESIATFLTSDNTVAKDNADIIDNINYNKNKVIIDRLNSIISGAERLGFGLTLVLVIISIIITFNTIRLTIYIAREEIGIMRLVGAENKYIRGPFMVEGVIYGVLAALASMVIFYPLTYWLGKNMSDFFGMNVFHYYISNFFEIFGIALLVGVFLGILSSILAMRKYLTK